MEIHYFSWLRNRMGIAKEAVSPPPEVNTPQKLIDWLCGQGKKYRDLFSHPEVISISVNDALVEDRKNHALKNGDKVGFFSPLAGG